MNRLSIIAILITGTSSLYAQGQQPNVAKLKADAQNVVTLISGDKLKTQIYCEIRELTDEAEQEENPAKTDELSEKMDNLEGKLGPEFMTLVHALTDIDAHSQDAQEIRSILEGLDELCED
jgi:predicted transcriptional regulator